MEGYKYLLSYQYSCVIYDLTVEFCQKFILGRELMRQRDQMVQAARSGKQNICEGYSLQSLESYIRFLGIANGSLKELLEDYEDYIRQKRLSLWAKPKNEGVEGFAGFGSVIPPSPPNRSYPPRPRTRL